MIAFINQDFDEISFELDYLFQQNKDVFVPFRSLGTVYSLLHDFDRYLLLNIHASIKLEYQLENVEYSSLKTRVIQILKAIPDELLKDPELKKLIGILLVKAKYWLLEKLANPNTIDSKEQIESIANKINNELSEIGKKSYAVINNISPHAVFNALDEIGQETNKLPKKEAYQYKSKFGNAILKSGININKPKILSELGEKTEITQTTEVIKPKKIDLLGESKWECILDGKTREMKVEDKAWLEKYHKQEIDIQSGDSLKVELKTVYSYNANSSKIKVVYDIIRVFGVIKPNEPTQLTF